MVNGEPQTVRRSAGSLILDRTWNDRDELVVEFEARIQLGRWVENSVAVERGPLVYALRIQEEWTQVENDDAYGEYYEVAPATPWNYALLESAVNQPEAGFTLVRRPQADASVYPWTVSTAPMELRTRGKRIPDWRLYNHRAGPLPHSRPLTHVEQATADEITLVPYGCTRLRITEFPVAR
jgi:hypothetical protein